MDQKIIEGVKKGKRKIRKRNKSSTFLKTLYELIEVK